MVLPSSSGCFFTSLHVMMHLLSPSNLQTSHTGFTGEPSHRIWYQYTHAHPGTTHAPVVLPLLKLSNHSAHSVQLISIDKRCVQDVHVLGPSLMLCLCQRHDMLIHPPTS